jgi:transposase
MAAQVLTSLAVRQGEGHVKEWVVIHKIKAMHDGGRGLSIRQITKELKISRNTVRKYLSATESEIQSRIADPSRTKKLDEYRDIIKSLLKRYPEMTAVKIRRKLHEAGEAPDVSSRSLRRYIQQLRSEVACAQVRHYEPVMDMLPGMQCQVDPGELHDVLVGGEPAKVYFTVFVLSFSRLMYVGLSRKPINTQTLMRHHDAAFRFFGGRPQECVYDQTRLVVLDEQYRELKLNERFHQYATTAGFEIRACEGYDPESKGKVEAGVKYVKSDALYGEEFDDWDHLVAHIDHWLGTVANQRTHGTTGRIPAVHYDESERVHMQPYLGASDLLDSAPERETRRVNKVGLISWKGNRYSVPMAWQRGVVQVMATETGHLEIYSPEDGALIAKHPVSHGKGDILKQPQHYLNRAATRQYLEEKAVAILGEDPGRALVRQLHDTAPGHYGSKLRGLLHHVDRFKTIPVHHLRHWSQRPGLTLEQLLEFLKAWEANPGRVDAMYRDGTNVESLLPSEIGGSHALKHYAVATQNHHARSVI